ncbi:MAG: response regulator transcription factor [Pseudomonadota bacterium]
MRLLMVDDHPVILDGLCPVLMEEPDIDLVSRATNFAEAIQAISEQRFDVAILDIELPEKSGIDVARFCLEQQPECKVVFLTGAVDRDKVDQALLLQANGFLLKTIDARDLVSSLRLASRGVDVYDASVTNLLQVSSVDALGATEPASVLSPQQLRVLRNVARGMTNKEIARHMKIGEKTARNYLASVFEKLGLQRRSEAAVWYTQRFGEPEDIRAEA